MIDKRSQLQQYVARVLLPLAAGLVLAGGSGGARAQEDLSIGGGLTVVGQAISNSDYATNGANELDDQGDYLSPNADGTGITYSVDVTFEKELDSGVAFVYLIGAQGRPVFDGANGDAEGDAFSSFNLELGQTGSIGVAEAWYEHMFFDEMFAFRLGKIDPTGIYDANEVANDQTTQFLADVFINNSAILFPGYTPGMNLSAAFGDIVSLSFGVFEEDAGATIAGEMEYKFFIGELGLHYELFDNPGNLRLTAWNSGLEDDLGETRGGFAFSLDQGFGDELMAIFLRLGFVGGVDEESDNAAPETSVAFSTGLRLNFGEGHHFAVAYAIDSPQDLEFYNPDPTDPTAEYEVGSIGWLEAYVDFEVTEGFHVALDAQLINGVDYNVEADAIGVFGFRTQVDF